LQNWLAHAAKPTNLHGSVTVSKTTTARLARICEISEALPLTMADILATRGNFGSKSAIGIANDEGPTTSHGMVQLAAADRDSCPRALLSNHGMRPTDMVFLPAAMQ